MRNSAHLPILITAFLCLLMVSCDRRVSETGTGERIYGNVSLLTESLYEAVEGENGIGRGEKINYRNMNFDSEGRLTETVHYWKHQVMQRELFTFGADGKLEGGEVYGFEGALLGNYEIGLNELGKMVEQRLIAKDGKTLWRNTFAYDNNGNRTEHATYDTDGNLTGRTLTVYDVDGLLLSTETKGSDNSTAKKLTHDHENFDSNGNWLRRIDRNNGKVVSMIEREINY